MTPPLFDVSRTIRRRNTGTGGVAVEHLMLNIRKTKGLFP